MDARDTGTHCFVPVRSRLDAFVTDTDSRRDVGIPGLMDRWDLVVTILRIGATIDVEIVTSHVTCCIGSKEHYRLHNLVKFADPTHRST